jgi:5-formaminoimidazole-4-carboxamide-1-beta-D-ribofuranosyl 5'-monophosphate synthetase
MHLSTAQGFSTPGFVPCVDQFSSEKLSNNEFYQYMRKTEKTENNYIIDQCCLQKCIKDNKNICIYDETGRFFKDD